MTNNLIKVYLLETKTFNSYFDYVFLLNERQQARLKTIKNETYAKEQIIGDLLLIYAISQSVDNIKIPLELRRTPFGKPYFTDTNYEFNMAHSKNYYAIALSFDDIGIDLEKKDRDILRLKRKVLTKNEELIFNEAIDKKDYIISSWVKKEATLKLLGAGLSGSINKVDTKLDTATYGNKDIFLYNYSFNDTYVSAASFKEKEVEFIIVDEAEFINYLSKLK